MDEKKPTLRLRCRKGHEYAGEPMTLVVGATGAMADKQFILCPYCVVEMLQTVETQVVGTS